MNTLYSSNTAKNLELAFGGESMANRRYLYFAKLVREMGSEEIAKLFEETAHQETAHAFAHLELIYPKVDMTIEKILEIAITGELYETNYMYPEFEKTATEEGQEAAVQEFKEQAAESATHADAFRKAAKIFKALTHAERLHAKKYQDALNQINKKNL